MNHTQPLCAAVAEAGHRNLASDIYLLRVLTVLPAAVTVTLGLIWGMERLVRSDASLQPPLVEEYKVPNPVLQPVEPTPVQRFKPEPPKPVEQAPTLPEFDLLGKVELGKGVEGIGVPRAEVTAGVGHFSSNVPVPTMMVQPNYPAVAASRGYEGFVEVQFDVTAAGATANVVVLKAEPDRIFNRAAIGAVQKWKYSPVMVDGQAQPYYGMVQRLVFELAD